MKKLILTLVFLSSCRELKDEFYPDITDRPVGGVVNHGYLNKNIVRISGALEKKFTFESGQFDHAFVDADLNGLTYQAGLRNHDNSLNCTIEAELTRETYQQLKTHFQSIQVCTRPYPSICPMIAPSSYIYLNSPTQTELELSPLADLGCSGFPHACPLESVALNQSSEVIENLFVTLIEKDKLLCK